MKLTNMVFLTRFLAGKVSHQLDFEIVGHRNVDRNLAEKHPAQKPPYLLKIYIRSFLDSLFDVSTLKMEK